MDTVMQTICKLPQLPQAQYDLAAQLAELQCAAVKLGLYDAADFLKIAQDYKFKI